jgi:hypothetical protein
MTKTGIAQSEKQSKIYTMNDYTKLSDKELLSITDANINKGSIPFKAVEEVRKRGLKKYVTKTINSFDFDRKGNYIS